MSKRKFLSIITLFMIALICVFAFGCTEVSLEDTTENLSEKYVEEAKDKVSSRLVDKGYEYNDVQVEYRYNYNGYEYYNIIIALDDNTEFATMLNILTDISSISFSDAYKECNMLFFEYAKCNDELYQISVTNEYILQNSGFISVYNSIAAKAGEGLTYKEKAKIYDDLDYYFTKTVDGKYKYSVTEAETIVAEKYNITITYLLDEVWYDKTVYKYYLKYYN